MAGNVMLQNAKSAKNDEFYTQLVDIENELRHYKEHFKGKTIFCNCDDPYESNFFKYFALNFNFLGLKKLICTSYDKSPVAYTQLALFDDLEKTYPNNNRRAYKIEITEVDDYNNDGAFDLADVEYLLRNKKNTMSLLKGNGDFHNEECVELLKEADIVVTNPPFSLFREYVAQLVEYNKKFLIIGNVNAITYKDIFQLIKNEKIWGGYTFNKTIEFEVPKEYRGEIKNGKKYGKVPAITWFTNLDTTKRHEELILYKQYSPEEYPKYDNYDAIEVGKVTDIPCDYYGIMGVPLTFLDKYSPNQFEILGCTEAGNSFCTKFYTNMYQHTGEKTFYNMKSARYAPMLQHSSIPKGNYYTVNETEGYITKTYFRIFIRRKTNEN